MVSCTRKDLVSKQTETAQKYCVVSTKIFNSLYIWRTKWKKATHSFDSKRSSSRRQNNIFAQSLCNLWLHLLFTYSR